MKKLTIAILAVSATLTSFAHAEAYVGAGIGVSSDFYDGVDRDDDYNHSGTSFNIYTGYYFNKVIGVEASYTDYGKFSPKGNPKSTYISSNVGSLSANVGYSFDCGVRPFVLLGGSYGKVKLHNTGNGSHSESDHGIHFALGIEYSPITNLAVRVISQADSLDVEDLNNNPVFSMVSLGAAYRF